MINKLDAVLSRAVARWVEGARRAAIEIVALALVATAGTSLYVSQNLGIHGGTEDMLSPELPFRKHWDEFREAFPRTFDPIYVVVEADSAARARDAAELLAADLERQPQLFEYVDLPGRGGFFDRHGLLYLSADELQDLADHLAQVQPYLAELSRDATLRGLFGLLTTGLDAAREGEFTVLDLAPVLDRIGAAVNGALDDRPQSFSWEPVILGDESGEDAFRVLIVSPVFDYSDIRPARGAILGLRRAIESLGLASTPGLRVRLTGDVALEYEELETVRRDAARAGVLSLTLVAFILFAALRTPWLVVSTLVTLVVGLVLTAGFAALAVGHLNPISVAFSVLFIGLSVDFAIHLCIRYRELALFGEDHARALRVTALGVGSSLVLCAITTAIGFFAFVPTDFVGVAELGLIAGTGMLIALACNLTLLPAMLTLRPLRVRARRSAPRQLFPPALLTLPARRAAWIAGAALLAGIGALALLPRASFDQNPLNLRPPDSESVKAFYDLLEHGDASPWRMSVLTPDSGTADRVAGRLRSLETVERTVTLSDYVPDHQDEKLAILGDIALFLGPIRPALDPESAPTPDEQVEALREFERAVDRLAQADVDPLLLASAKPLQQSVRGVRRALASDGRRTDLLASLESSLLGELAGGLRRLEVALGAARVGVDDLPDNLVAQTVADDGRVQVQVYPREDLSEDAALARFVDSVRDVRPDATGLSVVIVESARAVVASFAQALVSAVVVIALLLLLLWRRVADATLVMGPLLLAAALTAAASVLLDIPFNFADVIVIPLLMGIGVDSGIHLVHRYRTEIPAAGGLLATSTARAVLYSALTTIAGFGSLALSVHPGMASMGQLLTVGIALMLVCNLIILPALIALFASRAGGAPSRPEHEALDGGA